MGRTGADPSLPWEAMSNAPDAHDYDGWVARLGRPSCRPEAKWHLRTAGVDALPAIRRGLHHPKAIVRRTCVNLLDALVDEDSLPDLVGALDDEDPTVASRALHALACEACKQGACRPDEDLFVPRALTLLRTSPNPDIRANAVNALGRIAHRRPDVAAALVDAAEHDRNAGVRNVARMRTRRLRAAALQG